MMEKMFKTTNQIIINQHLTNIINHVYVYIYYIIVSH